MSEATDHIKALDRESVLRLTNHIHDQVMHVAREYAINNTMDGRLSSATSVAIEQAIRDLVEGEAPQ